jgi:hypothetical protein
MIVLPFAPSGSCAAVLAVRPTLQHSKLCEDTGSAQSDKRAMSSGASALRKYWRGDMLSCASGRILAICQRGSCCLLDAGI